MRISDWSSDVCSSDLAADLQAHRRLARRLAVQHPIVAGYGDVVVRVALGVVRALLGFGRCIELKSIAVLHVGRRGDLERVVERSHLAAQRDDNIPGIVPPAGTAYRQVVHTKDVMEGKGGS